MSSAEQDALIESLFHESLEGASLSPRERALLDYADQVTLAASTVTKTDIDELRAVGLDDIAIHDACVIVAYFAFVNRVADGLGVELEG